MSRFSLVAEVTLDGRIILKQGSNIIELAYQREVAFLVRVLNQYSRSSAGLYICMEESAAGCTSAQTVDEVTGEKSDRSSDGHRSNVDGSGAVGD